MRRALAACVCAILLPLTIAGHAAARPVAGQLDPSFAKKGWTQTPPPTAGGEASVELSTTQGGSTVISDPLAGQIVRLRPDGSLDTRFGHRGLLSLGVDSTASEGARGSTFGASAVAVDGSGRVLVFGEQGFAGRRVEGETPGLLASEAIVLRFTRNGRRDPSFGEGKGFIRSGFGLTSPYSSEIPLVGAMAGVVDSQDRPVLIAGVASPTGGCYAPGGPGEVPAAVVRLTSSGLPDPTFGSDGVSLIEGGSTSLTQLQIDDQDQAAVEVGPIGGGNPQCREGGTIYRLGQNGERLAEFGSDGVRSSKSMQLAALEPSGAMILSHRQQHHMLDLSRLSAEGTPEPSFGRGGVARIRLPSKLGLEITSAVADREGHIYLAGFIGSFPAKHQRGAFIVARVLADGRLDPQFGDHGWTTTSFPRPLEVTSAQAKLDAQGRLVVAGTTATPKEPENGGFVIARYLLGP